MCKLEQTLHVVKMEIFTHASIASIFGLLLELPHPLQNGIKGALMQMLL